MKKLLNNTGYLLTFSILFISILSCNDENTIDTPLEKAEFIDVTYGEHQQQKYDIYLPKERNAASTKVFVLIHGGGWIEGDKKDMTALATELQKSYPNYAVVNINYRLASINNSPFPMQIDDIKDVISHLKQKSEEYQISNQYALIGTSAGGHLSMLYAYAHDSKQEVDMVASIVGPTNFTDDAYINATGTGYQYIFALIQQITGINFKTDSDYFVDVSPFHVATSAAPPTILFYGGKDNLVPASQGIEMHAKLNQLGVTNEFTLYPNEGHGWEGESLFDTITRLRAFINTHF